MKPFYFALSLQKSSTKLGIPNVINESTVMNRLPHSIILIFLIVFVLGCKKNDPDEDQTAQRASILVSKPWRLTSITDVSGKAIPENQLNQETKFIYEVDIQFTADNKVKAIETSGSGQVVNGGTWYLVKENSALAIEVIVIKGEYDIVELTNAKMSLRMKVPVNGVDTDANMVFAPVIK